MKNLQDLLAAAANAAVSSDEAFARLQNLIRVEILPGYAAAMTALGHSQTYFSLPEAPFNDSTVEEDEHGTILYPVLVDAGYLTIGNAHYDLLTGRYYAADDFYQHAFIDAEINKAAQCVLIRTLISTLDEAIRTSSAATADAIGLLDLFA